MGCPASLPPGNSDATTVPASTPEALRNARAGSRIAALQHEKQLETPPPGNGKKAAENETPAPKLRREVQSKQILDDGGKPKGKSAPEPKRKATAKATGKAKASPVARSQGKGEESKKKHEGVMPKVETTPHGKPKDQSALATAVHESLKRGETADVEDTSSGKRKGTSGPTKKDELKKKNDSKDDKKVDKNSDKKSAHEDEDEKDDPQADEEEAEKVRAKKAHHARFMRFKRSLESHLVPICPNVCEDVHVYCEFISVSFDPISTT